jgi:hypothetical protein
MRQQAVYWLINMQHPDEGGACPDVWVLRFVDQNL